MAALEPGTEFEIEYREGKTCSVVSLSLREQLKLADALERVFALESETTEPLEAVKAFDLIAGALRIAKPDVNDEFLGKITHTEAVRIAIKCLNGAALSEDDKKKSE